MSITRMLNNLEARTIAAAYVGFSCVFVNLVGFAGLWTPDYVSQRASDAQLQSDWEAFTEGMNEDDLQEAYEESWLHWEFTSVREVHYHGWPLPYLFRVEMLQVTSTYSRTATPWPLDGAPILQFRLFALLIDLGIAALLVAATYFGYHAPRVWFQFRVATLLCVTFAIAMSFASWLARHRYYVSWRGDGFDGRFWYYGWLGVVAYRLGQIGIFLAFLCTAMLAMRVLSKMFSRDDGKEQKDKKREMDDKGTVR